MKPFMVLKTNKCKLLTLAIVIIGLTTNAQQQSLKEPSVEKSIYGIQTGYLGVWGHNEAKLTNSMALRSELGFDGGFWGGSFYDKTGFIMTPTITIEPRLYYNLKKRITNSKSIANNSGNFVSIKTSYRPNWFVISNYDGVNIVSDFSIIPTWGIRRHVAKNLVYESGIGVGFRHFFAKDAGYSANKNTLAGNLHLRIGYTF